MSAEPQMVTANRLIDGATVYLTAAKGWSERFTDGAVLNDKDSAEAALRVSDAAVDARLVVGSYLIEVTATENGPEPTSAKERIRAAHLPTFAPEVGSWTGRISD